MDILIRYDEIALKSKKSRKRFIDILKNNLRNICEDVWEYDGRLFCSGDIERVAHIFGVSRASYVMKSKRDFDSIVLSIMEYIRYDDDLKRKKWKINVKRVDKSYPINSMDIMRELVNRLNEKLNLSVKDADASLYIEIRHKAAFIYDDGMKGPGGLPYGSSGKAITLFSGGFDSSLSAYMMAKRGVEQTFLFFSQCNCIYEDVMNVWRHIYEKWHISKHIYVLNFSNIISHIIENVKPNMRQILLKRAMYKAATEVAKKHNVKALITGESLGQVSTQTLQNLYVLNKSTDLIVFRPLIGMNKQEIIDYARDVYDLSLIERVKERCNISGGAKVETKADIERVMEIENSINLNDLVHKSLISLKKFSI